MFTNNLIVLFCQYETSRQPIVEERNVTSTINSSTMGPYDEVTTIMPKNVTVDYELVSNETALNFGSLNLLTFTNNNGETEFFQGERPTRVRLRRI